MSEDRPIKKNLTLRETKGKDTVLYDGETREIHVLNPTAFAVWELCDGEHSLKDMEEIIRHKFSISEERDVLQDIQQVIGTLAEKGLIA